MRRFLRKLFGSTTSKKLSTRRTARLEIEHLDERVLPSTTGSVSQVLRPDGLSAVFYIDRQHNLWETRGGYTWQADSSGQDTQVSAGLSADGYEAAYIHRFDGTLWVEDDRGGLRQVDNGVASFAAGDEPNQVWYVRYGAVFRAHPDGGYTDWVSSYGRYFVQVSAGTDPDGHGCAYMLDSNGNVTARDDYGDSLPQLAGMGYTQIAGSVKGIVYALAPNGRVDRLTLHSTGETTWTPVIFDINAQQISAGTDYWGNSTVDAIGGWGAWGCVEQYNAATGQDKQIVGLGSAVEMAAGEGGHDYYVDSSSQLHDRADQWYYFSSGFLRGWWENVTDNVIGYNVS
jgi:hypothetical protein